MILNGNFHWRNLRATSGVIKAAVQVGLVSLELLERKKAATNWNSLAAVARALTSRDPTFLSLVRSTSSLYSYSSSSSSWVARLALSRRHQQTNNIREVTEVQATMLCRAQVSGGLYYS